jgi:methylmalonyl-CoA mutase cobalamin-binding subunit
LTALSSFTGTAASAGRHRILLSTTSSDAHTWNLVFLQLLLEESGHEVLNLGSCVPDALLLETARNERPNAIVISTVNGHGHMDGVRLARLLRQDPDTAAVPMVIGGNLGTDGASSDHEVPSLLDAGFDAVFTARCDPTELPSTLAALTPAPPRAIEARHAC